MPTLNSYIPDYLNFVSSKSKNTINTYKSSLEIFSKFYSSANLANNPEKDFILSTIQSFMSHLIESGKSPLTVSSYLNVVRNFIKYCEEKKYIDKGVCDNIVSLYSNLKPSLKISKDKTVLKEYSKKILLFKENQIEDLRDKIILYLLFFYKLSPFQIVDIDVTDIKFDNKKIRLFIVTKTNKFKVKNILLKEDITQMISRYLSSRLKTLNPEVIVNQNALFVSFSNRNNNERIGEKTISRILRSRADEVGLEDVELNINDLKGILVA